MEKNATFSTRNNFHGASYDYENEGCKANGEFRYGDSVLSVNINGSYTKAEKTYTFWASRDASGNLNLNGVPKEVIEEVAHEIKEILDRIEALNSAE